MSANGGLKQRSGFQRWVASLKRSNPPAATQAVPLASIAPAKRDDGATRVHQVPKDLIHRLRAQAASRAPDAPAQPDAQQGELTSVFRAPPELLERARRARLAAESGNQTPDASQVPTKPPPAPSEDEAGAQAEFQDWTEAASGISMRPSGLGGLAEDEGLQLPAVASENLAAPPSNSEERPADFPTDDMTLVFRPNGALPSDIEAFAAALAKEHGEPVVESASTPDSAPVAQAEQGREVDDLLALSALPTDHALVAPLAAPAPPISAPVTTGAASKPPQFRQPVARQVGFVIAMIALAAFLVLASR